MLPPGIWANQDHVCRSNLLQKQAETSSTELKRLQVSFWRRNELRKEVVVVKALSHPTSRFLATDAGILILRLVRFEEEPSRI